MLNPLIGHTLLIGRTRSGKSTLARRYANYFYDAGYSVAVLDYVLSPLWRCDFITRDAGEFLSFARNNQRVILVTDETGATVSKFDRAYEWLGTMSRQWGHLWWGIGQRDVQLSMTTREQTDQLFLFACGAKDAKRFADEYGYPELARASQQPRGAFFQAQHFAPLWRGQVLYNPAAPNDSPVTFQPVTNAP